MLTFRTVIAALTFATLSAGALAQDVTVMISGGFKAALEKLTPQYEAQSGDRLIVISGPSMGKTPQAIPARWAMRWRNWHRIAGRRRALAWSWRIRPSGWSSKRARRCRISVRCLPCGKRC